MPGGCSSTLSPLLDMPLESARLGGGGNKGFAGLTAVSAGPATSC